MYGSLRSAVRFDTDNQSRAIQISMRFYTSTNMLFDMCVVCCWVQDMGNQAEVFELPFDEPRAFFCGHVVQNTAAATVYPSSALG